MKQIKQLDLVCRCANVSTYEVSLASEEEKGENEEEVRTRRLLTPGDDVTVECVAYNQIGESRDIFNPCTCHITNMLTHLQTQTGAREFRQRKLLWGLCT